jgi:hypothetical protein
MITQPNRYTLSENGVTYGLHTFKDGINPTVICQLHASGEWITLAPATDQQVKHFEAHGVKSEPVVVEKKASKTSMPDTVSTDAEASDE